MRSLVCFKIVALLVLTGCAAESPSEIATAPDSIVMYTGGVIWTGEEATTDASVMVVANNEIAYVGDGANIRIAPTETIDLGGRFVMPGFIDSHVHFYDGGLGLASVDLRDAVSPEEFTQRISDHARTLEVGKWILIGNWDHENWGGELPTKEWVDEFTPNNPVYITRIDGHMALANSLALELAGLNASTVTPSGGEIVRHPNGELTGIVKDNAMTLVGKAIPSMSDEDRLKVFELAQAHALSLGLTQVHAVSAGPVTNFLVDAFRYARDQGAMKLRVNVYSPLESWTETRDLIEREGLGDDQLNWGGVKALTDGALGSTTAWFHDPYVDEPAKSGFPLIEPEMLKALMSDADVNRLRLAIHAIGDKAIDQVIDGLEDMADDQIQSRRYRIEHFQHPTPAAIERLAKNKIIASMQPYHAIDDGRWAESRIGPERIKSTYAFKTILDAGGLLSFGSDWPVAPLSPLQGVYAAVTRRTTDGAHPSGWQPQEKISVEQALRAYTVTNAYAAFEENRAGTLTPGKRADFVVLSQDPRKVNPNLIGDIEVLRTVIDGETVFEQTP
ncbi:MAG: amidohydrolase [Gammaproteobacteria bacterium]